MGIRAREGHWHYRFEVNGHEYTGSTGLAATERNETAALRAEAEARRLVLAGKAWELRVEVRPFSEALDMWLTWADGEHRDHPATARRLRTSAASLRKFLGKMSVAQVTAGDVEDYKSWRRSAHQVREVTLRHDLHALSGFFRYARSHNWCRGNPVSEVEIPSDADAVRMHVVSPEEEVFYCSVAEGMGLRNLLDQARIMVNQGCRPDEVLSLRPGDVDLISGHVTIQHGKSTAARRRLKLMPETARILSRRMGQAKWLFPSPTKPGRHIAKLNNAHADVLKATGLAFVTYDWRHTFATRAAAKNMPLASLAAILGHANLRTISKYVHPQQEHLDAAMGLMVPGVAERVETEEKGAVQ